MTRTIIIALSIVAIVFGYYGVQFQSLNPDGFEALYCTAVVALAGLGIIKQVDKLKSKKHDKRRSN